MLVLSLEDCLRRQYASFLCSATQLSPTNQTKSKIARMTIRPSVDEEQQEHTTRQTRKRTTITYEALCEAYKNTDVCGVLHFVCIPIIVYTVLIGSCIILPAYSAKHALDGASATDFISIGERCRIRTIDLQSETGFVSNEDGRRSYHCDVMWQYDFVVILNKIDSRDVDSASRNRNEYYDGDGRDDKKIYSNFGEFRACNARCSKCIFLDQLNHDNPLDEGDITECWSLKDTRLHDAIHPFWGCINNSQQNECYLLSDPIKILGDHMNEAKRDIIIGWIWMGCLALFLIGGAIAFGGCKISVGHCG